MAFESSNSKQLMREARIGLTIVGLLAVVFVYVAAKRMTGGFEKEPSKTITGFPVKQENGKLAQAVTKQSSGKSGAESEDGSDREPNSALKIVDQTQSGSQTTGNLDSGTDRQSELPGHFANSDSDQDPQEFLTNDPPPVVIESGVNVFTADSEVGLPKQPAHSEFNPNTNLKSNTQPLRVANSGDIASPLRKNESPPEFKNDLRSQFSGMQAPATKQDDLESDSVQLMSGNDQVDSNVDPISTFPSVKDSGENVLLPPPRGPKKLESVQTQREPELPPKDSTQFALPDPLQTDQSLPTPSKTFSSPTDIHADSGKRAENRPPFRMTATELDSFWSIAVSAYGNGQYFRALHQHNVATLGLNKVQKGVVVDVPSLDDLEKSFPKLMPDGHQAIGTGQLESDRSRPIGNKQDRPGKQSGDTQSDRTTSGEQNSKTDSGDSYLVSEGETLFSIAAEQLGQAARYNEIIQLNRQNLPANVNHLTRLSGGTRLALPKR